MKDNILISFKGDNLYYTGNRVLEIESDLRICDGLTVLCGKNGSGKSTFAQILAHGRHFRTNSILTRSNSAIKIKCIEFNDIHSLPGVSVAYYQQRYEEAMNEENPLVTEIIGEKFKSKQFKDLCGMFNLNELECKKINHLSSGELRKLLIINGLLDNPDLLILDNPYIGLDKNSQIILNKAIFQLKTSGKSILLIIQNLKDAPDFTDNFLYAHSLKISYKKFKTQTFFYSAFDFDEVNQYENNEVFEMKNCEIKYGDYPILKDFNWRVKCGERWSLTGPNGSGKSTLLSLLNADNPKSYSLNLTLFGKKRGTGESIWEIKRRIGYVSPEMQIHFHGSGTVLELISNGLNDTMGLYIKPSVAQKKIGERWLKHFKMEHLKNQTYNNLSSGEKQLVLIARAMIKEPQLLILDEPLHALDKDNKTLVLNTIEDFLNHHPQAAFIMVTHNAEELLPSIQYHKKL